MSRKKSEKYHRLCCSIRSNGWSAYFYAKEVSTRGFCDESVRSYFRSLGFSNILCWKTLETISSILLRCSFETWLCRNSKSCALDHPVSLSNSVPMQKKSKINEVFVSKDHHAFDSSLF